MILSLLGVGFLLFANSIKCFNNNVINANDSNDFDTGFRLEVPQFAPRESLGLNSAYNFRDTFDYSDLFSSSGEVEIIFDDTRNFSPRFAYGSSTSSWYCYGIRFEWLVNGPYCQIDFSIFNGVAQTTITVYDDLTHNLSDLRGGYNDLIIYFTNPIYINGDEAKLFDTYFTFEDNYLTTTYSGYYNFTNNLSSINSSVSVFGPVTFNNTLFKGFTNLNNGAIGGPTNLLFFKYDLDTGLYMDTPYTLPFNTSQVYTQNVLFSGVKMTKTTYNNLSNVGVFSYVRDTSNDDIDFHDFLFTLMDVPVYFITQFFNFELFGMNLAVAFAGLVTLVVMLCVVRIIMRLF